MPNVGPLEIAIVLIVALIILGPKKLPDMGRSLGRGMREFKGAISGESDDRSDAEAPELSRAEADAVEETDAVETEPAPAAAERAPAAA